MDASVSRRVDEREKDLQRRESEVVARLQQQIDSLEADLRQRDMVRVIMVTSCDFIISYHVNMSIKQ
jgi:hypothetical protein